MAIRLRDLLAELSREDRDEVEVGARMHLARMKEAARLDKPGENTRKKVSETATAPARKPKSYMDLSDLRSTRW